MAAVTTGEPLQGLNIRPNLWLWKPFPRTAWRYFDQRCLWRQWGQLKSYNSQLENGEKGVEVGWKDEGGKEKHGLDGGHVGGCWASVDKHPSKHAGRSLPAKNPRGNLS